MLTKGLIDTRLIATTASFVHLFAEPVEYVRVDSNSNPRFVAVWRNYRAAFSFAEVILIEHLAIIVHTPHFLLPLLSAPK